VQGRLLLQQLAAALALVLLEGTLLENGFELQLVQVLLVVGSVEVVQKGGDLEVVLELNEVLNNVLHEEHEHFCLLHHLSQVDLSLSQALHLHSSLQVHEAALEASALKVGHLFDSFEAGVD